MIKFLEQLKLRFARMLVYFYWQCEYWLTVLPSLKTRGYYFFEPISLGAVLVSLAVSAASFGAQLLISSLIAPKPKQRVNGKLTGDISLTDSVFSAPVVRIYGSRNSRSNDFAGGVEVGGNIIWASEIRKIQREVPSSGGGRGGKGSPKPPPDIQINYKIDLAVAAGQGRLRLLRLKLNEDVVYNILTAPGGGDGDGDDDHNGDGNPIERYEAEAEDNILTNAVVSDDALFSGGKKVIIGPGGSLKYPTVYAVDLFDGNGFEREDRRYLTPYYFVKIKYKAADPTTARIKWDDDAGNIYTFPATGSGRADRNLIREFSGGIHTLEIIADGSLEIDFITAEIIKQQGASPTGARDDYFPPEVPQDNFFLPEPYIIDTNPFERYNAPAAIENGVMQIGLPNGASLAWYEGTADQPVDPVIAADTDARYGSGSTPAFRNVAYARIKDLDFTGYGSIPALRMVVENTETQSVAEICLAEAAQIDSLTVADFDLTAAEEKYVRGYFVPDITAPTKIFEEMALLYNLSFIETNDGVIKAIDLSDRTPVDTITPDDLQAAAEEEGEEDYNDVSSVIPDDSQTLVREFQLQFYNPAAPSDYSTDRKTYAFPFTTSNRVETKSVNAVLTEAEADEINRRELQRHHLKAVPHAFKLPHTKAYLNPGDVIELPVDTALQRVRIEQKTGSVPGVFEISATSEELVFGIGDTAQRQPVLARQVVNVPANTVGTIIDIPALEDAQANNTGIYAAACPKDKTFASWTGATLYRNKGTDFSPLVVFNKPAIIGVAAAALPDSSDDIDRTSTVAVDFYNDETPSSVTAEQALDGANVFVFGGEVIIVETWTRDNDYPNRWTASILHRGQKNTKTATANHQTGERVVFLNDAVKFVALDKSEIGILRQWKFVTAGQSLEDSAEIIYVWQGMNNYNRETLTPEIGQAAPSLQNEIRIGVRYYSTESRYRRIEVSDSSDMSSSTVRIAESSLNLPAEFLLTRQTGDNVLTKYVRVAHSSNGYQWGADSNILPVTFADAGGGGGSDGDYNPDPYYKFKVEPEN